MLKIGQLFDHLNFGKYEPGHHQGGAHFHGKISPKSGVVNEPFTAPTSISILYLTTLGIPTGGEGRLWEKLKLTR